MPSEMVPVVAVPSPLSTASLSMVSSPPTLLSTSVLPSNSVGKVTV